MKIDEATGLPALPKGHFWRVREWGFSYVHVEIRKRHLVGSSFVFCDHDPLSQWNTGPVEIQARARQCFTNWHEPRFANLHGDYPPKKLG